MTFLKKADMSFSAKRKPDMQPDMQIEVEFETMALGGRAKGTPVDQAPGSFAVFTEFAAPGDRALVRITNVNKRYVEADLVEVLVPGPDRVKPVCPYFGICGGCNWQHISYERQLAEKAQVLSHVLARNGLAKNMHIHCEPSDHPIGYRCRADMTFVYKNEKLHGGFLRHRSHELLDISQCPLLVPALSESINAFKCALVNLVPRLPEDWPFKMRVLHDVQSGRLYGQPRLQGSLADGLIGTYRLENGAFIEDADAKLGFEVDGLKIKYDPFCFTQINLYSNEDLVSAALEALELDTEDLVLELYAGIGNFSLPIAKRAGTVFAIESARASSRYSKINAKRNGLPNIEHKHGDAERACRILAKRGKSFTKVLADPPRSGMGQRAVNALCDLEPQNVVLISCHPDTLAQDLKRFVFRGYWIESIRAFDMFGQTFHVETVTKLRRL